MPVLIGSKWPKHFVYESHFGSDNLASDYSASIEASHHLPRQYSSCHTALPNNIQNVIKLMYW